MRQTNSAVRHALILRGVALILAFILFGGGPLLADISGLTLKVSEPSDAGTGKSYNAGVNVKLSATWTKGDTPPFAVTFKANDAAIGTSNVAASPADFVISGAALAGGANPKVFKATAIETSVPNAPQTPDAAADKAITIDTTLPVITVKVDNGPNFSTVAGNNEVKFTVSSDKDVSGTPEVTISPAISGVSPSPDGTPTTKQFKYKMTLTGTVPAGTYVIRVVCKDQTLPAATANSGAGQDSFAVVTSGPQPAVIQTSTPVSPTHLTSFKLSGSLTTGMVSVAVYEGTTKVADGQVTGTTWSAQVLNATEGEHKYTVKGKDTLGNESAGSGEFVMRVDTTAPKTPKLVNPKSPTNLTKVNISGTDATDPIGGSINSTPVTVALKKSDGTPVASVTANADGSFTFTDVPLPDTDNTFFAVAEDNAKGSPGNLSGFSNFVRILRDASAGNSNSLLIATTNFASQPVPLASGTWIGPGNYSIQVGFSKDMASDTNPTLGLTPANGSEISNSSGRWVGSSTFVGQISIPAGQGATYDGKARQLRVSGAKDTAGNVMSESTTPEPFAVDTTPPTTTFDSTDPLYISASMTTVQVKGTSSDAHSGVGFVNLTWEKWDGTGAASASIPIFDGASYNWTYSWDVSTLGAGKYKLWAVAGDKTKPSANLEAKNPTGYRTVMVAKTVPNVSRISIGDLTTDINAMNGGASPVIASPVIKLTAVIIDNGGAGLNLNVPPMTFTLTHQPTNTAITGNYANNGTDTVTFSFAALTQNGTYTVSVMPVDKASNTGLLATRSFIVDTTGPTTTSMIPASATIVNDRNVAIGQDVVWGFINDSEADYSSSTIEVSYNGRVVGNQVPFGTTAPASTSALVWDLYGPASHSTDQSADGRYDVTITPRDVVGNAGAPRRMYFTYDSQGPGFLAKQASGTWIGLDHKKMGAQISDAPKDISSWHSAPPAEEASWQNSQGAGANIDNSSFTVTVEGNTFTGTKVGTSSLELNRPDAPNSDEDGPGVTSMSVEIITLDKVTDGGPNLRNASWTHEFDYLRPKMFFDDWVEGAKFCKNRIELPGTVTDRGTNQDVLQVVKAETSFDERYEKWAAVTTVDALPTFQSSFTTVLDVSGVPEGALTIQGRCYDRANNMSNNEDAIASEGVPASVSITIVRTPPPAPTLVLPLNDSITKQRGNTFKWSKVDAADRYIFQVADDSGFNNILNTLVASGPATFTGVLGQVMVQTQGSFSAPKDGTYYWRVASIELCRDGYLQSSWSSTWRLVVDTVRPKVLEVQPTPSSGNKITTGMVTFTIRFNELMDTTVSPVVALTSAGGQMMLIEQVSFRDNTWTGTTVIPKDSSAVYDGNAVIAISGAKDKAGNEMETDSTNQVVINTGPAFETKIFSNPAHEYEIMIITRSTEALQAPPTCSVTQGGAQVPVMMNFLKERYYAGSYRIDPELTGKAYIDISGSDLYGMVGRGSVEFTVTSLTPATSMRVSTPDGLANIDIGSGTVAKAGAFYLVPRTALDELTPTVNASVLKSAGVRASTVSANVGTGDDAELREICALEEIGPSSLKLSRKMRYTGTVKHLITSVPTEKIALYRQSGNAWTYCGGQLKGEQISAEVAGGGRLALMADLKAPRMSRLFPAPNERLEESVPTFEGQFADGGSGLLAESLELKIDGEVQTGVQLESDGSFRWTPKQALKKGKREIEVSVSDRVGNSIRQAFTVTAPGPFALDELQVFPNPSRNQAIWFTYNLGQRADEIVLKIYDVSGKLVTSFETMDFTSLASGKLRWDLTNNDGAVVSNGVYFYRFEAKRGGATVKTRGKLAILR